jgi:hypothetical protein
VPHYTIFTSDPEEPKQVDKIFEIRAVVSIAQNLGDGIVKWNNTEESGDSLIDEAKSVIQTSSHRLSENESVPLQVFLLYKGESTHFYKTTRGGMFGTKKYFWDVAVNRQNSKELAEFLDGKTWELITKDLPN